jgi:hypothetical protein
MTKRDGIALGIKFLGVYFAVLGVVGMVILISTIAADIVSNFLEPDSEYSAVAHNSALGLVSLIQPLAYLGCAFMLTRRTDWCLRMAGVAESEG